MGANNENIAPSQPNKTMTEIKTQFKAEGDPVFPLAESKENDNSADSSSGEETKVDPTPSPEEDKTKAEDKKGADDKENLADHPRWKEREEDWSKRFNDQEKRHTDELEKIRQSIEEKFEKKREALADSDIPSWFGGDAEQWAQYKAHEESRLNEAEERAVKRLESKAEKDQKAIDDATKYFNEEVTAIETDKTLNPDGVKVDRNKLLKFVLDNKLCDTEGRWNYRAGFQLMGTKATTAKKDTIDEKKKVADATMAGDRAETKTPNYATSADFQKPGSRPW